MKYAITARVVGHKLFQPNPKDAPHIEVAKVSLVLSSLTQHTQRATTATIHVDLEDTNKEFALGRVLRLQFEDYQQELPLGRLPDDLLVDGEHFDATTGELTGKPLDVTLQFGAGPEIRTNSDEMRAAADLAREAAAASASRARRARRAASLSAQPN